MQTQPLSRQQSLSLLHFACWPPQAPPGDWVVQNGGNSGVGRSLIAIAKLRGIRTISLVRRRELTVLESQ
jgi:NADPH:quinone reductase-like Zn-dependent oxidoreductase